MRVVRKLWVRNASAPHELTCPAFAEATLNFGRNNEYCAAPDFDGKPPPGKIFGIRVPPDIRT